MARAKNRQQFVKAWQDHMKELYALAVLTDVPYEQAKKVIEGELYQWINKAAVHVNDLNEGPLEGEPYGSG